MKHIRKIFITAFALVALSACEDILDDVKNYGGLPADDFITSASNAQTAVNGAYSGLYGLKLFRSQIYYYLDFATNELEYRAADGSLREMTNFGYFDGSTYIADYWKDLYSLVARSNDACSKIYQLRSNDELMDKMSTTDQAKLLQMIGECNFLRGLGYFYLTRSFGDKLPSHPEYNPQELGVPIADTLVVSKQQLYKSRHTLEECWNEIIKDFKTAYDLLPASWPEEKLGAVTKGAAAGYLGQVYMYFKDYKEAKKWFEESMRIGNYALVENYAWNFDIYHENNSESIFEVQFETLTSDIILASYMWRNFGPDPKHWGTVNVSQQYVNKFSGGLLLEQSIYDDIIANPNKYIAQTNPRQALKIILELAFQPSIGVRVASRQDFFELFTGDWDELANEVNARMLAAGSRNFDIKRDDTRWGTIDSKYIKVISAACEKDTDPRMYDSFYVPNRDSISNFWSGKDAYTYTTNYYGFKKYIPYNSVENWTAEGLTGFDGHNSINQRIFRLGDMYLQYAEACYREGDTPTAIEYLNKVRRRAWKQSIDTPSTVDYAGGDFMEALVAEREKELCLEGHLWFDYLRWWDEINIAGKFADRGFDANKHHRLPIPLPERQVVGMDVLKQNSNY